MSDCMLVLRFRRVATRRIRSAYNSANDGTKKLCRASQPHAGGATAGLRIHTSLSRHQLAVNIRLLRAVSFRSGSAPQRLRMSIHGKGGIDTKSGFGDAAEEAALGLALRLQLLHAVLECQRDVLRVDKTHADETLRLGWVC